MVFIEITVSIRAHYHVSRDAGASLFLQLPLNLIAHSNQFPKPLSKLQIVTLR